MFAAKYKTMSREEENSAFAYSFLPGLLFVVLLWLIALLSYLTEAKLSWLGIFPRNFFGLIGVVTGPLIHADLLHLLSNSFPFVLLSGFILFQHRRTGADVLIFVYVLSGLLTWFIGRQAYHVGASGVIYGMASYLLFVGFIDRDRGSLAVSLAVLFLYSGLFYGLFPGEEHVSWEGHLAGSMAGFAAAFTFGSNAPAKEKAAEGSPALTPQQQHTSHTLGTTANSFHWHYTLEKKETPVTFTYRISQPVKEGLALTMNPDSSSMVKYPPINTNEQRNQDTKQENRE